MRDFKILINKVKSIKRNFSLFIISLILSLIGIYLVNNYNNELNLFVKIFIFILLFSTIYIILVNWIFNEEKEKYTIILTAFMVLILVLQLVVMANQTRIEGLQIGIFNNQTEISKNQVAISETQTEILRSTSQSLRPKIILTPYQINYEYYLNNDFLQNGDNLEIAIINLGETIAPLINVQINDGNFFGGKSKDIENLESLGYSRANFTIIPHNKEVYPGLYNVTFIVRCPLCEKEFDYQSITICLFNENFNISDCEF